MAPNTMNTSPDEAVAGSESASQQISTVHVIFKTHLDIGYTDFARNVIATYHTRFIPLALAPKEPDRTGFELVADPASPIETAQFRIGFDPRSGAIRTRVASNRPALVGSCPSTGARRLPGVRCSRVRAVPGPIHHQPSR